MAFSKWLGLRILGMKRNSVNIITITIYILYEGDSKHSKLHLERTTLAEDFCCGNTQPLLIKLEKTKLDFCLSFCADETNTKVRIVQ